jgi:hypothetical protein
MPVTCAVLRCQNPGDIPLELNGPGARLLETLMCEDHESQIEDGVSWVWSETAQAVVIRSEPGGDAS